MRCIDSFAQNNGQLGLSDARYINALKLFLTGVSPLEYQAHRGFAFAGRHLRGAGPRVAAQMQSLDELRHVQTQVHTISHYNKYLRRACTSSAHMHDRVWYLSRAEIVLRRCPHRGPLRVSSSRSGSPSSIVLTNLLFVPFMSGAAYNGDLATVTFGFSAQSDESRHMTLGIEVIKFLLEQHPDNVPIVQNWVDKWFWRGYRVLGLVAMMMDYMLPKKVMSWREAWEIYFTEAGGSLFPDLARYGLRVPKYADVATAEADQCRTRTGLCSTSTPTPPASTPGCRTTRLDWLSEKYPNTFDRYYRPRWEMWAQHGEGRQPLLQHGLPQLCHDLPDSDGVHRARRSGDDQLPQHASTTATLPLLLRRLQRHLRQRAGEVRPGVAAGAPDLPGQLRRRRPCRTCWPGTR